MPAQPVTQIRKGASMLRLAAPMVAGACTVLKAPTIRFEIPLIEMAA